jgi:hypothetical protein
MPGIFEIDQTDLKKLVKFYKRAPKEFQAAAAGVLNSQAFTLKKINNRAINSMMTIRDPKFVSRALHVVKARATDINKMESMAGSVSKPRFSGWIEQETGQKTTRTRKILLDARAGSWKSRARGYGKMRPAKEFYDESDFQGKHTEQRIAIMLSMMRKGTAQRKPFLIKKKMSGKIGRMGPGLYRLKAKKTYKLQTIKAKGVQPKRKKWMTASVEKLSSEFDLKGAWEENIKRILARHK